MEVEEKYREEERFDLETVINRQDETPCRGKMSGEEEFLTACSVVRAVFDREWESLQTIIPETSGWNGKKGQLSDMNWKWDITRNGSGTSSGTIIC